MKDKLITVAIRSYEHAQRLKEKLERAEARIKLLEAENELLKKTN